MYDCHSNMTVAGTQFLNNVASTHGGADFVDDCNITIEGTLY